MKMDASKFTNEEIKELFKQYVTENEDRERHTEAACKEVDAFDQFCEELFPGMLQRQRKVYDKMMDVAVEFEEGGFIAGFITAMNIVKEQERLTPRHA